MARENSVAPAEVVQVYNLGQSTQPEPDLRQAVAARWEAKGMEEEDSPFQEPKPKRWATPEKGKVKIVVWR